MTPKCKLCGSEPDKFIEQDKYLICCDNKNCSLVCKCFSESDWNKLMRNDLEYVAEKEMTKPKWPEKKEYEKIRSVGTNYNFDAYEKREARINGWNDCHDEFMKVINEISKEVTLTEGTMRACGTTSKKIHLNKPQSPPSGPLRPY